MNLCLGFIVNLSKVKLFNIWTCRKFPWFFCNLFYWNKGLDKIIILRSFQWDQSVSSVAQLCPTLCDSMDWSTPGLPVHHQLPYFAQTHVHWVGPSNHLILCHTLLFPLSVFPSIRVFSNESVICIRWPKYWSFSFNIVLPMNIQDWFPLGLTGWIPCSPGDSWVFSITTVQKYQFIGAQLSYSPTLTSIHDYWKNHSLD